MLQNVLLQNCHFCDFEGLPEQVLKHIKINHQDKFMTVQENKEKYQKCEICGKLFKKNNYQNHLMLCNIKSTMKKTIKSKTLMKKIDKKMFFTQKQSYQKQDDDYQQMFKSIKQQFTNNNSNTNNNNNNNNINNIVDWNKELKIDYNLFCTPVKSNDIFQIQNLSNTPILPNPVTVELTNKVNQLILNQKIQESTNQNQYQSSNSAQIPKQIFTDFSTKLNNQNNSDKIITEEEDRNNIKTFDYSQNKVQTRSQQKNNI
ncbi:hypothetical protein ABPG72_017813 [Tetrahymena utriculariae]